MQNATLEQSVVTMACDGTREEQPRVEVLRESLCSASELRQAVIAGAVTSGIVCTLVGVGVGYVLGLRRGRE